MGLSIEDRLKRYSPFYYPYKIAKIRRRNEPELGHLHELVPAGCTAVDVGVNRGYYSYALAKIAARVEGFEPNPVIARFAGQKLGARVCIHEVALADREGREKFYVPQDARGVDRHLGGRLSNEPPASKYAEYEVPVATLDSYKFDQVGFIKIDAEGSELAVIKGARETIARWEPNMVVELLVDWHEAQDEIATIASMIPYTPLILIDGCKVNAFEALASRRSAIKTANVLFVPTRLLSV